MCTVQMAAMRRRRIWADGVGTAEKMSIELLLHQFAETLSTPKRHVSIMPSAPSHSIEKISILNLNGASGVAMAGGELDAQCRTPSKMESSMPSKRLGVRCWE